jgi:hypothetical protein
MQRNVFVLLFVALSALTACDTGVDGTTYQSVVRAEIEQNCLSCHTAGGVAPFALDDASVVESFGPVIVAQVEDGSMPPYHFNDACREVADSLALDQETRDKFIAWRDNGFAMGDEADYVAPDFAVVDELPTPDLVLRPTVGYLPTGAVADDYRCLILDHEFAQDTFVVAQDIRPDRMDLVHHVIIFEVSADLRDELEALDAAEEGPGYTCFGDSGLDQGGVMIGGWAPGPSQVSLDGDSAIRIKAGSVLVMQVHYNTVQAGVGGSSSPDRSELLLWTLPAGAEPAKLTTLFPVAHGGIYIEAGNAESSHTTTQRVPVDATVVGVAPHMHLLGRELHSRILREDGSSDCLAQVDNYDFNWQRGYFFAPEARPSLDLHDTVELTCVYDNSASAQPIVDGEQVDPQDVTWGEGTFDEMCLNFLVLETPYAGGGDSGTCGGFQGCMDSCDPHDATCAVECMGSIGYQCVSCALQASLYGSCMQASCGTQMLTFSQCYTDRPEGDGFLDVMVGHCATEWAAAAACMDPVFRSGSCADDFVACPGIAP